MNRPVKMFRCYRDPHIPPKPRNAFTMGTGADQLPGEAELSPYGVHVKTAPTPQTGAAREFIVPWANVECLELIQESTTVVPLKKTK